MVSLLETVRCKPKAARDPVSGAGFWPRFRAVADRLGRPWDPTGRGRISIWATWATGVGARARGGHLARTTTEHDRPCLRPRGRRLRPHARAKAPPRNS